MRNWHRTFLCREMVFTEVREIATHHISFIFPFKNWKIDLGGKGGWGVAQNLIECVVIGNESMYQVSARLDDGKWVN